MIWLFFFVFFFKQKTAYEMRISDWSSRVLFRSIFALDVLAHDDEVDVLRPAPRQRRGHALQQAHRAHVGVEVELAAQRDQKTPQGDVIGHAGKADGAEVDRSEEHTSELQSVMRSSYDVFCLKKKKRTS